MSTIEERAKAIATQRVGNDYSGKAPISEDAQYWHVIHSACYEAATDQDRIARTEERERCINAAQHWLCRSCCETCYSKHNISACYKGKAIRKALEEGEG